MNSNTATITKGSHVQHDGESFIYRVTRLATKADGTEVAQIAPAGQHAGGAWVRLDSLTKVTR